MADEIRRADKRLQAFIRIQRSEALGWTQAEAAEAAGMSAIRWRQVEGGRKVPMDTLARMLDTLGVMPETLRQLSPDSEYEEVAAALQLRQEVMPHEEKPEGLPSFIADETEAYLWNAPGISAPVRKALILHLRTMKRAEADPVARALLGQHGG